MVGSVLSCELPLKQTNIPIDSISLLQAPEWLAIEALEYAKKYTIIDTEYFLGGQDWLRAIKIDCSGLVVNCYAYAVKNTQYTLPFADAAVINFYDKWTKITETPRPGDLIFMGDPTELKPTHIAIFVKEDNEFIYFIDATSKPEEGINGVTERYYPKNDLRFKSFGAMLLSNH